MLITRLSLVPSFALQSARIKMPKSSFSCRHCSATFSYADSLRRHSILQHAVKVRVDSSGQQEEFEVEDWERECEKIRRRQSKSPYVKKDQRDHTSDRRQLPEKHADPKPKPKSIPSLMSLRLDTPEVIHGKESTPMGSNSSLSVANKTMRAHVQVPTVDHSPSFYLNASFRSLTPPGGIAVLPDVEGTASPSANPLLPGTPGAVSSESECNLSLCRGVRLAAPEPSIPVSLHVAALDLSATSAVESQSPAALSNRGMENPGNNGPTNPSEYTPEDQQRNRSSDQTTSQLERSPIPRNGTTADAAVASSSRQATPSVLSGSAIMALIQCWPTTDVAALQLVLGESMERNDPRLERALYDVDLVRRTIRCVAGYLLSGVFDVDADNGRSTNITTRRWLMRFLE
jgi:hypothetical protein